MDPPSDSVFPVPSLQQSSHCDNDKKEANLSSSINTLASNSEIKSIEDEFVEKDTIDDSSTNYTDKHVITEESTSELPHDDLSQIRIVKTVTSIRTLSRCWSYPCRC